MDKFNLTTTIALFFLMAFASESYSQKPVLNRPLSLSVNAAKHYHIGKIAQNDFYAINQTGFNIQLAATYRMWEYWGLSFKYDYSIIPMDATGMAEHFLELNNTAIEVRVNASSISISQIGLGYYHDFPLTKKIFFRVMPYVGLSVLKSPSIDAEIFGIPHSTYMESFGTSVGYFYELQVKPTYAITRELRVNAFISYSGGFHEMSSQVDGVLLSEPINFNYGRISAGIGVEIAIPWIEMNWKY